MKKRSRYVCFCMRALPSVAGGRVVEVGACGRGHSWVRILFLPVALPSVAGGRWWKRVRAGVDTPGSNPLSASLRTLAVPS